MATERVNHPAHYQGANGRECIDEMIILFGKQAVIDFCRCNAYKYRFRAGKKEGASAEEDLAKAEWYMNKAEELESKPAQWWSAFRL